MADPGERKNAFSSCARLPKVALPTAAQMGFAGTGLCRYVWRFGDRIFLTPLLTQESGRLP